MPKALPLAFISLPGGYEWIIIAFVALLLFGSRLPSIAKSLGRAMHEFKAGLSGALDENEAATEAKKEKKDENDKPA